MGSSVTSFTATSPASISSARSAASRLARTVPPVPPPTTTIVSVMSVSCRCRSVVSRRSRLLHVDAPVVAPVHGVEEFVSGLLNPRRNVVFRPAVRGPEFVHGPRFVALDLPDEVHHRSRTGRLAGDYRHVGLDCWFGHGISSFERTDSPTIILCVNSKIVRNCYLDGRPRSDSSTRGRSTR